MKRLILPSTLWVCVVALLTFGQAASAQNLPDFTALVEDAAPGVVNISTSRTVQRSSAPGFGGFGGQEIPEIFRHFFGDSFPAPPSNGQGRTEERQSLGSGFVISEDGYVMTNAHVVQDADEILVRLNDRRELRAEVVGSDPQTDVAVLKIDANDLPTLNLGDSDELKVGEWVAAIGSPFGFDHSVTAGIVSAINRTLPRDAYVPFIQTDVAINPGNSGGPLFNLDGEVVGINSQIFTRSGGFMGVSFAIPINVAMDVAEQLREGGRVDRGWLGVMIQPVSDDLAESFGMENAIGALIADLDPEGPAAQGGLQAGDVILEVNGEEVERSSSLPRLIGKGAPGTEVELTLMRDGEELTESVELGSWPDTEQQSAQAGSNNQARLGVMVAEIDDTMREQLNVPGGVIVRQVESGSVAAEAGIRPGDVLVSIDHRSVSSSAELVEIVEALPTDRAIPVRLFRDGRSLFVALRLE
ncbi:MULTISPECIES: DegQ family serine endoprotease [Halomonadaceae]|jgi:serine protease Do|uniref:Probable periplasmic serine endoprotease DegP-like n=1 Tax=Vreelandella titanicae TaxID=664683 RepID=A0A653Q878_9GAMM|nr:MULTISPECIES: DegQ family serine endoprotease [Halomonas]UEQ06025.1 DegQ family serine endoprotease [Halomonas profundus]KIN14741.1 serine peptidase [Halomonas sp. KHS3]MCE7517597.1 DegQ family serine endoprotease [Halomonas titanicae]QKS23118.1 Periplasmic serine endoprotease DegP [Halomonas titanicae]QNU61776.1 DegQ family serine endoprotease [Halomonas titanicae]|tara:strand:+ start:2291 stop:3703 length:1413 start_codon:yes stop_codon:yes gene_type:complete